MAAKTNAYRTDVLNVVRGTNITAPAAVYQAAYTVLSSDGSSGGTEVSGNGYLRVPVTLSTADSSGAVYNSTELAYPKASGTGWGEIVGTALWSSSGTSGYCFVTDVMSTTVTINSSQQLRFSSGAYTYQEI